MSNFTFERQAGSVMKFKLTRRGRKIHYTDDARLLGALPKDVPETTWWEIFQKEENDLVVLEIREEIVEEALSIVYEKYMERQVVPFAVHCAGLAWLKLIDWEFYRHDPGEDPNAAPLCYIPKRVESWTPDPMPETSPKDTWVNQDLTIIEHTKDVEVPKERTSSISIPKLEDIPSEYWFPGKVNLPMYKRVKEKSFEESGSEDQYDYSDGPSVGTIGNLNAESEVLQRVTDYSSDENEKTPGESQQNETKSASPEESVQNRQSQLDGLMHGAGDSVVRAGSKKRIAMASGSGKKSLYINKSFDQSRSRRFSSKLPPLGGDSTSGISMISACRLRNLRLDTQYEISPEKFDTRHTTKSAAKSGKRK